MAKRETSGVLTSYEEDGQVRMRRFVVMRADGRCIASYTILHPNSNRQVVKDRREWELACTLDGKKLPMVPDPYSNTGWRINRELTASQLQRVKYVYQLS